MLVVDGPVSASDGTLDVPEGGIDPLECRGQGGLAAGSSNDWLMDAAGVSDTGEAAQAITDDGAGGIEIALGQGRDFGTAETLMRRNFKRLGLPCGVVSTAATIGVLPGEPRPRLPPFRSPPR